MAFGCGDDAKGPSDANDGPGSISGSYTPDGVAAIISGQVLLQAAAEGGHNGTQVAVRGYASTASTNAEGMFRLELILSEEAVTRSDEDAAGPLSVEVVFSHPGYRPADVEVTVEPGQAVVLDETVTLSVILSEVLGQLVLPSGLEAVDFSDALSVTLTLSDGGDVKETAFDEAGVFSIGEVLPGSYAFVVEGGPFNTTRRNLEIKPDTRMDLGEVVLQLKESERLNYETAIEGTVKLQGITDDNGHGGIRVENVGTAFAAVTASMGAIGCPQPRVRKRFSLAILGTAPKP